MSLFSRFLEENSGATSIEYALIAVLVSIGIIGSLNSYTESLEGMYAYTRDTLTNASN